MQVIKDGECDLRGSEQVVEVISTAKNARRFEIQVRVKDLGVDGVTGQILARFALQGPEHNVLLFAVLGDSEADVREEVDEWMTRNQDRLGDRIHERQAVRKKVAARKAI